MRALHTLRILIAGVVVSACTGQLSDDPPDPPPCRGWWCQEEEPPADAGPDRDARVSE